MKRIGLLFSFLVILRFCFGQDIEHQTWFDSLHRELGKASLDTNRVHIWYDLANYHKFSLPDSGMYYSTKAIELARELDFVTGELKAMHLLGLSYTTLGNRSKSLQINLEGLRKAEEENERHWKALFLMSLGDNYRLYDFETALNYLKEAHRIFRSMNHQHFTSISGNSISATFLTFDQVDSALKFSKAALSLADSINVKWVLDFSYETRAGIHRYLGNVDSSLHYYRKSLDITVSESTRTEDYLEIAKLQNNLGRSDSTIYFASKSLQIAVKNRLFTHIVETSLFISGLYKDRDPIKALDYTQLAITYKDSLSYMSSMASYTDFKGFDEQQRQYEIERVRNEFQSQLRINALLGGSFTLLVIAFFLYRNNRNKQRAKQKIEKAYDELKSTQSQLIHSEKMASLGELTAGIAHEIQNPLNFVNNFSEVNAELVDELEEEIKKGDLKEAETLTKDIRDNEQKIAHHGRRAEAIVKSMLQHSRTSSGKKELTDINALADEYLRLAYHGLRAKDQSFNADFETELDESLPKIEVVPQDIGRVLLNLINNAFQAVNDVEKPLVTISTSVTSPLEGGKGGVIEIRVKDNGPGIPDDIKDKIFQPFFTTKPTGEGTGLGLSMSYDIVTKGHEGELKMETKEGEGAEFIIQLKVKGQ